MSEFILETEDLTKEFAGFVAVNGVNLRVERGTIHALIGPNGAGKTTCFNLLTKFLQPTRGRIVYKGSDITALAPAEVARLGMVRSFQISAVFPHLTVLENVRIALQRERGGSFDFWRSSRVLDRFNERALELIADVGLSDVAQRHGGRTALWPQARARDRDHARARSGDAAARRADRRHGPRGHRPDHGADQARRGRPHRADGRAQSQRGREPLSPHHRADARPRAGGGRLRDGAAVRRRSPIRGLPNTSFQEAISRHSRRCCRRSSGRDSSSPTSKFCSSTMPRRSRRGAHASSPTASEAERLYDERFVRMWEFYLASSEMAFRESDMVVFQIQMASAKASYRRPATISVRRKRGCARSKPATRAAATRRRIARRARERRNTPSSADCATGRLLTLRRWVTGKAAMSISHARPARLSTNVVVECNCCRSGAYAGR